MSGVGEVWYGSLASPLGEVFIAASTAGICRVSYAVSQGEWRHELEADFGLAVPGRTEAVAAAIAQLEGYFEGSRRIFDVPLDLSGMSPFQQRVLRIVERVPWGGVLSYGEVAEEAGVPGAARAIGGVMRRNPVPILIPCHRVIGAGGRLGGFMGGSQEGLSYKVQLLRWEGVEVEPVPGPGARLRGRAGDSLPLPGV